MKKNLKRAVSLVGTLAMAATLAVPVSYADAANTVTDGTTLELEDFIVDNSGYSKDAASAEHNGAAAVMGPVSGIDQSEYTVRFDVTDAGNYQLELGIGDNGAAGHISAVKMAVNGVDYGYFTMPDYTDGEGFSKKGVVYATSGNFQFRTYLANDLIALSEGENTIVFTAYNAKINTPSYGEHVLVGYDYITFSKAQSQAVEDGTILEAENFLGQNSGSGFSKVVNSTASGAALVFFDPTYDLESKSYSMTFDVAQAGNYSLEIGASERGASDWISPVMVTVNGVDYGYLWKADNSEDGFARGAQYTANGDFGFRKYQTSNTIALPAGENTIVFTGYPAKNNSWNNNGTLTMIGAGDLICMGVDYVKFAGEKLPAVANGTTLELEDFVGKNAGYSMDNADAEHNGAAAVIGPTYGIDQSEYTVRFDMEEAGNYYLEMGLCEVGAGAHISAVKMSVNGVDYGYFTTPDSQNGENFTKIKAYAKNGNFDFRVYEANALIAFEKGENTIVFTAYNAKINTPCYGTHVLAGYDYITFTKDAARKITDGTRVELEEFTKKNSGFGTVTAEALSDGVAASYGTSSNEESVTYSFEVDADVAGEYYLSAGVADRGGADWLSPVKLSVNGADVGYFRTADHQEDGFSCTENQYAASSDGIYKFNRYTSKAPVALNEGVNQISYTLYNAQNNSFNGVSLGTANQIYAGLDYMTFNKVRTLSGVTMEVSDTLAVDGVSAIVLKDGDGKTITASDVAGITYRSSLETVATVTAEGKVTGVKPGRTRIDAEILVNPGDSETILVSAWVNVVEDDIFIANVQIAEDGAITFEVVNNTADWTDYAGIKAIAASYLDGKMKSVASFDISELNYGSTASCEMTLTGYEDGDDVCIYVWDGIASMLPVMTEKAEY